MKRPDDMSNEELDKYIDDQLFVQSFANCSVDEKLRKIKADLIIWDKIRKEIEELKIQLKGKQNGTTR